MSAYEGLKAHLAAGGVVKAGEGWDNIEKVVRILDEDNHPALCIVIFIEKNTGAEKGISMSRRLIGHFFTAEEAS